jgi:hypothetical protein
MDEFEDYFKKYKLKINNEKMEDFCLPKKYTLQPQQEFLPKLLKSKYAPWKLNNNIRGILLYHQIGAGKTCTSITIAETFKNSMNIIVVLPASLIGNYLNELKSPCPTIINNIEYLTEKEKKILNNLKPNDKEYQDIMDKALERINKYYKIYSYHKFVELVNDNIIKNLNNTLLIIDEIQNMISLNGTFYNTLSHIINKSKNIKLILLTATPIFDKPIEIALTLNLLTIKPIFNIDTFNNDYLKIKNKNNKISYESNNLDDFKNKIKYMISYYRGAPPQAYPKIETNIVKCKMLNFQYKSYLTSLSTYDNIIKGSFKNVDILKLPQNFFLGSRIISNIAFPNKNIADSGFESFDNNYLKTKNIGNYSIKFLKIYRNIKKSNGPVFVYSNFKDYGGLKSFIKFIEYNGWKNYLEHGEGKKRFCIWTGDESQKIKDEIKCVFNNPNNFDGSKIKMMLGSPSIKEGVSLLRVKQVHILEPYWNLSRIHQIIGRAFRFCSHKDLSKDNRFVQVYIYLSVYPNVKTIDQYILSTANKKQKLINEFENALKEAAIDCNLFINRNSYKNDEHKLKCFF